MKSSTTVMLDADVKFRARELLSEMGLNLTQFFHICLREFVRTGEIPFPIKR